MRLLPTPTAQDFKSRDPNSRQQGLADMARRPAAWPTPTANDAKNSLTESQRGRGALTARIVETEKKLLPTPRAFMRKDSAIDRGRSNLGEVAGGKLNPDWVEPLMGYPAGWTDLDADSPMDIGLPEAWIDGTWEEGLPRVTEKRENRVERLKCLGNAVVPQVAELLWRLVMRATASEG